MRRFEMTARLENVNFKMERRTERLKIVDRR